ncbi:MAG: DUF3261 domain-containing protein [Xanthomonadales bacterium]|nr:hypothetical protein [Xanthomonadales bacterium]MCC6591828.1 DUF3261 domain-containing protein [Xanthomonadales bacterium]MCE7931440.1 DUF3261 domain-containing protein [Xanthomonadales bacterium PRO6]
MAVGLLLAACTQAPPRPVSPPPILRLPPASLGAELSLQQRLSVIHAARTQHADALLQTDAHALRLVLLVGPRRLLTLSFDGERIDEQRDPALPAELAGERFVSDIQLACWPADAIRSALPAGWSLIDDARRRTLIHAGEPVTEIRYGQDQRWLGRIDIEHVRAGYRLRIESVPAR